LGSHLTSFGLHKVSGFREHPLAVTRGRWYRQEINCHSRKAEILIFKRYPIPNRVKTVVVVLTDVRLVFKPTVELVGTGAGSGGETSPVGLNPLLCKVVDIVNPLSLSASLLTSRRHSGVGGDKKDGDARCKYP
jgi:hypothetical protein